MLSLDPTENLSVWFNYDWAHSSGEDFAGHGSAHGVSAAGRVGITDTMGLATRVEYVNVEDTLAGTGDDVELITATLTGDRRLTDNLVTRLELRYDVFLDDAVATFVTGDENQLVALWEMYFEF